MPFIEDANHSTRGDILVFVIFEDKTWYVWIECVRVENILSTIEDKINKGFILIKRCTEDPDTKKNNAKSGGTGSFSSRSGKSNLPTEIEFVNGYKYGIKVEGDARINEGEISGRSSLRRGSTLMTRLSVSNAKVALRNNKTELIMQYHELLPDTYRVFEIVPNADIGRTLRDEWLAKKEKESKELKDDQKKNVELDSNQETELKQEAKEEIKIETKVETKTREFWASINIFLKTKPINLAKATAATKLDSFKFFDDSKKPDFVYKTKIPERAMKSYFDIQQDELPSPAAVTPGKKKKKQAEKQVVKSESDISVSEISAAEKVPLLSNESLKNFSKVVKDDLSFVAYLGLSENEITTVGFDCLAAKKDAAAMCLHILLYWKKTFSSRDGEKMAEILIASMVRTDNNKTALILKNLLDANLEYSNENVQRSDIDPEIILRENKLREDPSMTIKTVE